MLGAALAATGAALAVAPAAVASCGEPAIAYRVSGSHPHDAEAFTQGLVTTADGRLVEGTGLYGRSRIEVRASPGGPVTARRRLAPRYFGEGVTVMGERVYQLTWRGGRLHVYRLGDLEPVAAHDYEGEGWGLTSDGESLIMSDGGSELTWRRPDDFAVLRRLTVRADGRPVRGLNELEHAGGAIFANVWPTDCVARIDAASGRVTGWIDLAPLRMRMPRLDADAVANGIALGGSGVLWVTGKLWPRLFELRLAGADAGGGDAPSRRGAD